MRQPIGRQFRPAADERSAVERLHLERRRAAVSRMAKKKLFIVMFLAIPHMQNRKRFSLSTSTLTLHYFPLPSAARRRKYCSITSR